MIPLLLVTKSSVSIPADASPRLQHPVLLPNLLYHHLTLQPPLYIDIAPPISSSTLPNSPIAPPIPSRIHPILTRSMTKDLTASTSLLASKQSLFPNEPNSFIEAFQDTNWRAAMTEEFHALLENSTWDLVPSPPSINLIGYK